MIDYRIKRQQWRFFGLIPILTAFTQEFFSKSGQGLRPINGSLCHFNNALHGYLIPYIIAINLNPSKSVTIS
jgi:hypothetical protein